MSIQKRRTIDDPPDQHGTCSNCEMGSWHLWEIPPFPGVPVKYLCKRCFESDQPHLSLGNRCDSCGSSAPLIDCNYYMEDQSHDRLKYSPFLTNRQQKFYFPDQGPMVTMVCKSCKEANSNLLSVDEERAGLTSPPIRKDTEPITHYQPEVNLMDEFQDRTLLHDIAVLFAKDVFKSAGYMVRSAGFEDTYPELLNVLPYDESSSLVRLRSNPDLLLLDPPAPNVFRVECKVTSSSIVDVKLPTQVVERMRTHHPDSILWMLHLPTFEAWVLKIRDIDWAERPVEDHHGKLFYLLGNWYATPSNPNPVHWQQPGEIFSRLTPELLQIRFKSWREALRQYFVPAELSGLDSSHSVI